QRRSAGHAQQLHRHPGQSGHGRAADPRLQESGQLRAILLTLLRRRRSAYIARQFRISGRFDRSVRLLRPLLLVLLAAIAAPSFAQDSLDIVAVVNDQAISKIDLMVRMQLVMRSTGLKDSPEVRARLTPEILRALIDDRLKKQEANSQGITVTRAEIQRAL